MGGVENTNRLALSDKGTASDDIDRLRLIARDRAVGGVVVRCPGVMCPAGTEGWAPSRLPSAAARPVR